MNKLYCLSAMLIGFAAVLLGVQYVSAETAPTSTAQFRITFNATWSDTTHPNPGFPSNDHWSAMVGTMHNSDFTMWRVGELATPGMKNVAEFGANGTLESEVNAAIAANDADQWIRDGFSPFSGVATASAEITADSDFPLLSLATMVAPSPDWFAGVDSVSLLDGDGNWIVLMTIPVYPYDAGTDSGSAYLSPNAPTMPFEPIADYRGVIPFSSAPVGTLTIERSLPEKLYLPVVVR